MAALVDRPRVARREARCLSPKDAQLLLDAAREDRLFAFYAVALAFGLRRGEALALRWSDVDLDAETLRVTRTLSRVDGGLGFTEPKSLRSRRTVPLPAACVAELRAHRTRQLEERLVLGASWQDFDLVFPSLWGTPLDPRNATRLPRGGSPSWSKAGQPAHAAAHLRVAAAGTGGAYAGGDGDARSLRHRDHDGRLQPCDAQQQREAPSG